ncbi:hypothetical protein K2X89_14550, partial [Myxococcota bacterium]|nr:hypothetical protein [Myxococcota bacterium]
FNFSPIRLTTQIEDLLELKFVYLYDNVPQPFFITKHIGVVPDKYHAFSGIIEYTMSQARPLRLKVASGVGTFYDGAGVRFAPQIEWRPNRYLLMSIEYDERFFWGFDACKGSTIGTTNCTADAQEPFRRNTSFETRLVRLRFQIAFNTEIAWSTLVQYDNLSNGLSAQSRLRWIITPGREFFLVVGQDFDATPGDLRVRKTQPVAKLRWTFRF